MEQERKSGFSQFLKASEIFDYAGIAAGIILLSPELIIAGLGFLIGKRATERYLDNRKSRSVGGNAMYNKIHIEATSEQNTKGVNNEIIDLSKYSEKKHYSSNQEMRRVA